MRRRVATNLAAALFGASLAAATRGTEGTL